MANQSGNTILKRVRTQAGLTQQQLADRAGLARPYLCQLETGGERIGHRAALAIWAVQRVDFDVEDNFLEATLGTHQSEALPCGGGQIQRHADRTGRSRKIQ